MKNENIFNSIFEIANMIFSGNKLNKKSYCCLCGRYIEENRLTDQLCVECFNEVQSDTYNIEEKYKDVSANLDEIIAAVPFKGKYRDLIINMKYEGHRENAKPIARIMVNAYKNSSYKYNEEKIILVPVPMHKDKEKERGFNQAYLIAREIEKITNWKVEDILYRRKEGKTQASLNRKERFNEIKNVYGIKPGVLGDKNTRVIIVDDVITTGATISACSYILAHNNYSKISSLLFACGNYSNNL